jgi:lipopolysaccharide export LptBFGC system permease protein LptF
MKLLTVFIVLFGLFQLPLCSSNARNVGEAISTVVQSNFLKTATNKIPGAGLVLDGVSLLIKIFAKNEEENMMGKYFDKVFVELDKINAKLDEINNIVSYLFNYCRNCFPNLFFPTSFVT